MNKEFRATFLGTGTSMGVPVIGCKCDVCQSANPKDKRLRTSLLLEYNGETIVFDSGPDFRYQMLRSGVENLSGLVFTHEHKDHVAGMDDVRAFNFIQKQAVTIYAHTRVEQALRNEFHYAFAAIKYPGVPEIKFESITKDERFEIGGKKITPIEVLHHKLPVLGFRIDDFTYITDANYISTEEKKKIRGSKILVLNALRKESHISHFTLQQAIDLAIELEVEQAYFTHISHQLGAHELVSKQIPKNMFLAYDGLQIDI
jgi:phosphoribosyl 1,2-cyclic phosphate phosphodiesterase